MPILHADQLPLSREIGFNCREAGEALFLTDDTVAAADTVQGLYNAIDAAAVHAEYNAYRSRLKAAIARGADSQEITDALVAPLTTVAGLVNLTQASNYPQNRSLYLD
jgi:hypothetical protein